MEGGGGGGGLTLKGEVVEGELSVATVVYIGRKSQLFLYAACLKNLDQASFLLSFLLPNFFKAQGHRTVQVRVREPFNDLSYKTGWPATLLWGALILFYCRFWSPQNVCCETRGSASLLWSPWPELTFSSIKITNV